MRVIFGIIFVLVCVLASYAAMGGHLAVLNQPFEYVIIVGSAIGAFIIANTKETVALTPKYLKQTIKGAPYHKRDYVELITLLFVIIKITKNKGMLALENHIDEPTKSNIFQKFPGVLSNTRAITFLCDYLRMMTMGCENPHQMDTVMEEEIETYHHEIRSVGGAFQTMADAMPALGIVAAVLGVIHTMGSISQPPEILGKLIGGALVGTFAGVFISYGFIGPLANNILSITDAEIKYFNCIRASLLAYLNGYPPLVAVEYARKGIEEEHRPSFLEIEQAVSLVGDI